MEMFGVKDPNRQILAVGYEPVHGVLRVQWRKGVGEHRGVPEDLYLKLRRVPFAYRQYKATIQGKFSYTKIEVKDGKGSDVQNATRRICDSGTSGLPLGDRGIGVLVHPERT